MPRYKLTIEYDGGPYNGWQLQPSVPTVQGAIEKAVIGLNNEPALVYGSGRTDAGVHALEQIAHVDLVKDIRDDKVRDALNYHLGENTISILHAEKIHDDFHARFDATERHYYFRMMDRRARLALELGRIWRVPYKLDVDAMHEAAQVLVGHHDFTTFRDNQCQAKSPVKTIDEITVLRAGEEIHIHIRAPSFLHKQVRSITGTLNEVGRGNWSKQDVIDALAAKDRTKCGPVAPPEGLYLVRVSY